MIVLDTSGLLAAIDGSQRAHRAAAAVLRAAAPPRVLSPFVLAELDYLLANRVSAGAARALIADVATGAYQLEAFDSGDVAAMAAVIDRYAELQLGLADASLVILADRHGTLDLLTLDQRHFRAITGAGGKPFRILPADA